MAQRILNVRVRPARATVLISQDAGQEEILLAFDLFSKIWGGYCGQILIVDPKTCDDLTTSRLGDSRPEFIYGIGLDDEHWKNVTRQACQPRFYYPLQSKFVKEKGNTKRYDEDYILVNHALVHFIQERQKSREQTLRLVRSEGSSSWSAYCAAMFGIHYQNLRKDHYDEETVFSENSTSALINLATEFVKNWQPSWLDVTMQGLTRWVQTPWPPVPTIVLVQSIISDLSLFWNLRAASWKPVQTLAIPLDGATEPAVLQKLKEWLLAVLPYGFSTDDCCVTSQSVPEEDCQTFGRLLQETLAGTSIETVDYRSPRNESLVAIPYEYTTAWPVEISGRKLTILPPKPKRFESLDQSQSWFVDLLKDVKTGRAVDELRLPPSPAVYEVLNGPCPPIRECLHIHRFGYGRDGINIRCSNHKEVVNFYLPTREEVFGEILREFNVESVMDEKRSSYVPVIERFGGISLAASACSGRSRKILATLADKGTMTPDEIRGVCRLGKGEITPDSYNQWIKNEESPFHYKTERMKRVSKNRFLQYGEDVSPDDSTLNSFLEYWVNRKILARQWRIGPCGRCRQKYYVSRLNIQRQIVCNNCGHSIALPDKVPIGYCLQRAVRHAIKEGIIPVVLTGRFLHGMNRYGFFWLPGIKYKTSDKAGDIDILACCDGKLIFCECKKLKNISANTKVWSEVIDQFVETANLANTCQGDLAVLAAQVDKFPQNVQEEIKDKLGSTIPYLLLNKKDLELGYRKNDRNGLLYLDDLISTKS